MPRKKISTTIYITREQDEELKLLHARTKVPVAVYVREGIDLVLRKHAHEMPGQISFEDHRPDSGLPDPSLRSGARARVG